MSDRIFCEAGIANFFRLPQGGMQYRINESAGSRMRKSFGQIHRLVDGGAVRHPVQQQNLAGAQAQQVAHPLLQALRVFQQAVQSEVEAAQVFQRLVNNAGAQALVRGDSRTVLKWSSRERAA